MTKKIKEYKVTEEAEKEEGVEDYIPGKRIIEEPQGFALKIKSDRVPLKFLLYSQHSEIKQNKFSTADILSFLKKIQLMLLPLKGLVDREEKQPCVLL